MRDANLWGLELGREVGRDQRWELADLRQVAVDPLEDVDALIEAVEQEITSANLRVRVIERLEVALRRHDRPGLPLWESKPHVMFDEGDLVPRMLHWGEPTMTAKEYDEKLAAFLGDLACGVSATEPLAVGIAQRVYNELARSDMGFVARRAEFVEGLAARLTDRACVAGQALPDWMRIALEQVAAAPVTDR